ncbi:methyltransferase [Acanthamoeba castellanii str. Neff]|uniref:tRNA (guanine(46)-N(7))-methyltransferase n=1 Tax=Acanthamoeba castellanii (strain ATCC 30010 / Neff) TaxID=1257118 RepID=L8GR94_ACACF|nr:methyltransferase [Acanthamoeba castellanii str. Neff]ELR14636.1 methyltransferase [Acanthamoeba castellanii str. Neff]
MHRHPPSSPLFNRCPQINIQAACLATRLRPTPNPLARHCQKQLEAYPDWRSLYADPRLPFHLDLGCGKGHLVYHLACEHPEMNFLGLELQEERVKPFPALPNLAYVCCNVNVSLEPLLKSYASHAVATATAMTVKRVSILYPDPWFKKRHAKRRMVTPELVRTIHGFLDDGPDSEVYLETDFGEGFFEAKDIFLRDSFVLETDEKHFPPCRFGMSEFAMWVREDPSIRIFTATFRKVPRNATQCEEATTPPPHPNSVPPA